MIGWLLEDCFCYLLPFYSNIALIGWSIMGFNRKSFPLKATANRNIQIHFHAKKTNSIEMRFCFQCWKQRWYASYALTVKLQNVSLLLYRCGYKGIHLQPDYFKMTFFPDRLAYKGMLLCRFIPVFAYWEREIKEEITLKCHLFTLVTDQRKVCQRRAVDTRLFSKKWEKSV